MEIPDKRLTAYLWDMIHSFEYTHLIYGDPRIITGR
jgi:hypothetical protein